MSYSAKAISAFAGEDADELSFEVGQVIEILPSSAPAGWLVGKLGEQEGLVPSAFLQPLQPEGAAGPSESATPPPPVEPLPPAQPSLTQGFQAVALGSYDAKGHGDLSFSEVRAQFPDGRPTHPLSPRTPNTARRARC